MVKAILRVNTVRQNLGESNNFLFQDERHRLLGPFREKILCMEALWIPLDTSRRKLSTMVPLCGLAQKASAHW
jgi:acyl-ACP thioesterase